MEETIQLNMDDVILEEDVHKCEYLLGCRIQVNLKEAVHYFDNLALEYSTRCTDVTLTLHFLFFKKFKVRQHILFRKCGSLGP